LNCILGLTHIDSNDYLYRRHQDVEGTKTLVFIMVFARVTPSALSVLIEKLLAWLGIEPTTLDIDSQSGVFDTQENSWARYS